MNTTVTPVAELTDDCRRAMRTLLDRCFEGVTAEQFEADLDAKDAAVLLRDGGERLLGFTTFRTWATTDPEENPATIVQSGDTIVDPDIDVGSALSRAWIHAVRGRHADPTGRGLYWLLIVSGFRTYRFLPVFFRAFHPRADTPEPAAHRRWRDALAARTWGPAFDPATGIVRFARPQRLRGPLVDVPAARRRDVDVAFFLHANPGHVDGDELVCLTELCDANLTPAGARMLHAGRRRCAS